MRAMTKIRPALLCAALSVALCACAQPRVLAPRTVTLAPGARADIGHGATFAYDSYSDSRCPQGVLCVWAGELVYRFTVATRTTHESFAITLPNTSHVSAALGGARIALDRAHAPPSPHIGNAPAQYPVTLTVSRP
jgi:hypothetical protein